MAVNTSLRRRKLLAAMSLFAAQPDLALAAGPKWSVGILSPATVAGSEDFRLIVMELNSLGFVENRNLTLEWRYSDGNEARLGTLAKELVAAGVHAIVTVGTPATRAAMAATRTIPIVTAVGDPVGAGLARKEGRPGGNVTGLSWGLPEQAHKVIELQRALVPDLKRTFLIVDGHDGGPLSMIPMFDNAAREAGIQFDPVFARTRAELDRFLSRRASAIRAGAMTFTAYEVDPADMAQSALAGRVALLAFRSREWVEAGGAVAHGFFHRYQSRRIASLLAAVLRGKSAAELPFEMPDSEWVAVNRRTCSLLGIAVPPAVILRAELVVG